MYHNQRPDAARFEYATPAQAKAAYLNEGPIMGVDSVKVSRLMRSRERRLGSFFLSLAV